MQAAGNGQREGNVRIGLFAVGLAAYWSQFPGLQADIERRLREIERRLGQWGEVVSAGIVDTPVAGTAAGEQFAEQRVDVLVCFTGTYATSSIALPVVQRAGAPLIVLHLQPAAAMEYAAADTSTVLAYAGLCGIPELTGILQRTGKQFAVISGHLHDTGMWDELGGWCRAAQAARAVRSGRFGMLGQTYPGMLDMATDFERVSATLGTHIELMEIGDLQERVDAVPDAEVTALMPVLHETFAGTDGVSQEGLHWSAQVAAGLQRLAADFALDGLAYYVRGIPGTRSEMIASNMIVGNTLLTSQGIPGAGEGDLKTAMAMKIMHELGAGGSFTEFLAMDFAQSFFLMGHDGPCHPAIADGRVQAKELSVFHGKAGGGVSVQMRAKPGPVTILCLTQGQQGELRMLVAEGESLEGPVPDIGNSCHRLRFGDDPAVFMERWCAEGPTHHVALGLGHMMRDVQRVGMLLGLEVVQVR